MWKDVPKCYHYEPNYYRTDHDWDGVEHVGFLEYTHTNFNKTKLKWGFPVYWVPFILWAICVKYYNIDDLLCMPQNTSWTFFISDVLMIPLCILQDVTMQLRFHSTHFLSTPLLHIPVPLCMKQISHHYLYLRALSASWMCFAQGGQELKIKHQIQERNIKALKIHEKFKKKFDCFYSFDSIVLFFLTLLNEAASNFKLICWMKGFFFVCVWAH